LNANAYTYPAVALHICSEQSVCRSRRILRSAGHADEIQRGAGRQVMAISSWFDFILSGTSSSPAEAGALFLIPFLHEDIAIIAAALMVAQGRLSIVVAFPSLAAGMISRDLLLYGLGAAARRFGLARRALIGPRVERLGKWINGNLIVVMFVARVVPGLMFPTYVACGWFGISLKRYAVTAAALTMVYVPVVFSIAVVLGQAAMDHIGEWAWMLVLVPIAAAVIARGYGWFRRATARPGESGNP
jgi:membrane protein DedA with SNARE-associated domain